MLYLALRISILCTSLCLTQLHWVMPPPPTVSFFSLSGKRRLAGCPDPLVSNFAHRRTRKRSLRHLQLILHRFTPPSSASRLPPPPHPQPDLRKPKLKPHRDWTWRIVCSHRAGHSWGLRWHIHRDGQLFHFSCLDHGRLRRGLISTVCTVSTWCPCCLFVFLSHHMLAQ